VKVKIDLKVLEALSL